MNDVDKEFCISLFFVESMERYKRKINAMPLDRLAIFERGSRVAISRECIVDFDLTGLSNWDFLTMRYWEGWTDG